MNSLFAIDDDRLTLASSDRPLLMDVSRLVRRRWIGRIATGVDKVCEAYLRHYAAVSRAVVRRGRRRAVLTEADTQRLIALLLYPGADIRKKLALFLPLAIARSRFAPHPRGLLYLNIGHVGVDSLHLTEWIESRELRAVYFVHDVIPISHPEFCRAGESARHWRRMTNIFKSAALIITNSQHTADEIIRVAAERQLRVPPITVSWICGHEAPQRIEPEYARIPYFLYVGTIEARKNHILLLHIWKHLVERLGEATPRLVLVGQRGWEADHVFAMLDRCAQLGSHVVEMGRCSDEVLASLLPGARALLMPSFAEGFGMPVIEAMQVRTPLILSDLPAFREIAGDIPLYLNVADGLGWEAAILEFTGESAERDRQKALLNNWVAPTWNDHFAKVDQQLSALLDLGAIGSDMPLTRVC